MRDNTKQTSHLIASGLLACVLALSGCTGAVVGVGTAAITASTTEKGFSTSVSDGIIFAKLKEKFLQQNQTLLTNADITVNDGEVILTGKVKAQEDKSLATKLAWEIKGVRAVANHLKVSETPSLKQIGKDNAAVGLFRTKIGLDDEISSLNFSIDVVDGVAYLSGFARNQKEMDKVVHHANTTRYINEVITYIVLATDQRE